MGTISAAINCKITFLKAEKSKIIASTSETKHKINDTNAITS